MVVKQDYFPQLKELTLKAPNKGIISFVASGIIPMWTVVKAIAASSNSELPTIQVAGVNDSAMIGIAVGGSGTAVNPDGTAGNAADEIGDIVDVAMIGSAVITKALALASSVEFGSNLTSGANGRVALQATPTAVGGFHIIGLSFGDAAILDDIILIFLGGNI